MNRYALLLLALAPLCLSFACATVSTPSGLQIRYVKMPLIDSNVATIYRHEWLDSKNVLHEETLTINADMQADAQLEALRAGLSAALALQGVKALP